MSEYIKKDALLKLVAQWIDSDKKVAGPTRIKPDLVNYKELKKVEDLLLDEYIHPVNSVKEFIFPRHEVLYGYKVEGKDVQLIDEPLPSQEQIVIAARPCDAAAFPLLDHVMNWDFKDEPYNKRRELTTIITLACRECDDHCFCTSVGLGPGSEKGSDAMLIDMGDGSYEVRCFSDKGKALFEGQTESVERQAPELAKVEGKFDVEYVQGFLNDNFEHPMWQEASLRCLGCGSCAYTCPTCHCFDIVDEGNVQCGERVRNWDTCQSCMFTLHASGHNPRPNQPSRQRQRLMHKFHIYPEKFGELLCTGCGNCTRNCPVGLGIINLIKSTQQAAEQPASEA